MLAVAAVGCSEAARDAEAVTVSALPVVAGAKSLEFKGGRPVPMHGQDSIVVSPGEAGTTADTLLYLNFDGSGESDASLALPPGPAFTPLAVRPVEGRFDDGLLLSSSDSSLAVAGLEELRPGAAWTMDLWIRPTDMVAAGARLIEIPGLVRLGFAGEGALGIDLLSTPRFTTRSKLRVKGLGWTYLGLSFSEEPLRQLRLVVNDAAEGWRVVEPPTGAPVSKLVIGAHGADEVAFQGRIDDLRVRAYGSSSAEMLERWEATQERHALHEVEVRYEDRGEQLLVATIALTSPSLSGDELLRGDLFHAAVDGGGLVFAPGHWSRLETEIRPPARTTHPAMLVGEHLAMMFGGEIRDTHFGPMVNTSDTWFLHLDEGRWEPIPTEDAPAPRCHQSAAYSPDHDLVLLTGGFRNDDASFDLYDDTWLFHVSERRWELVEAQGVSIGRSANNAVIYIPPLRVFLVVTARGFYLFDPDTRRWTRVPHPVAFEASGEPIPGFRPSESMTVGLDPRSGKLLLFGGANQTPDGRTFHGDTYFYDLAKNRIDQIAPTQAPSPRVRPGFAYDPRRERFVLFGGVQDQSSQREADLWTFDPAEGEWERQLASNSPSARGGYYGMVYDPDVDRFYLLCGRHARDVFLDEVLALELNPEAAGTATYVFDRNAFSERRWFTRPEQPAGTKFRFRGSSDLGRWSQWRDESDAIGERYLLVEVELGGALMGAGPVSAFGFVD